MPKVYDDWEKLVGATLRKQELWELFHDHSRTPSGGSATSTATPPASPLHGLSPLNRKAEALPSSSTARVSPLNSATRFKSGAETPSEEKEMMRRNKSRMRLDRWILTRWLSKTFHSTSP